MTHDLLNTAKGSFLSSFKHIKPVRIALSAMSLLLLSLATFSANAAPEDVETRFGVHRLLLFKFKEEATLVQLESVKQTFCEIREKVPGMHEAVWAEDMNFDAGNRFTHAVMLSFDSEESVKAYEVHPDHLALMQSAPPIISDFFEMNYETNESNVSRSDTR